MKPKNRVSRQEPNGCGKIILLSCAVLLLLIAIPFLIVFVSGFYYAPAVQRFIDGIEHYTHIPVSAERQSDLIAFACDSRRRVYAIGANLYGTDLYTVKPDGSRLQLIKNAYAKLYSQLNWSPDGNWIALEAKDYGYWDWDNFWYYETRTSEIYVIRFDGLVSRRLTYNRDDEKHPRWSSDGQSIFFTYGHRASVRTHQVSADGGEIKPINQDDQYSYRLSSQGHLHKIEPLKQPNKGHSIIHWDGNEGIHVFDTKSLLRKSSRLWNERLVEWSPNGKWLAIISAYDGHSADGEWIRVSEDENNSYTYHRHLYLKDADTGRLERFVHDIHSYSVAWSPDSEWLAFASNTDKGQLFKIRRDGRGLQQLADLDCRIEELSWSPT
ncbi:MAG: hypothetical protein OXI40_04875 [Chloroflexota bacterium]|nr:hypothetical protein [Chloroflexota bacterium]